MEIIAKIRMKAKKIKKEGSGLFFLLFENNTFSVLSGREDIPCLTLSGLRDVLKSKDGSLYYELIEVYNFKSFEKFLAK